ncbi:unnamed protein product [Mycetohabitans rhizoxinica HKI 454]|uniref:Uncharacterized protein n=1 Tax=Mycetohabitans rhizoxinica (strain DSM 19002 / CIP 109453 / HKI 454) TaxID=882378 RepID=E5AS10_MYCRK|nr:unnamed protein product [Mycetohabitans rhizoxinica HKI 454]
MSIDAEYIAKRCYVPQPRPWTPGSHAANHSAMKLTKLRTVTGIAERCGITA